MSTPLATALLVPTALFALGASVGGHAPLRKQWIGVTVPSEVLELGSAQSGVIESMSVEVGSVVRKGAVLFALTTELECLEVERLAAVAGSDAAVRQAHARLVQAEREERRYLDLHERKIAGDAELDRFRREAEVARIELERARLDHRLDALRHREAEARLQQRIVRSPIDGYVAARHHARGEAVEMLQPVLRLVRLAPMWVELDCPVADAELVRKGTRLSVAPAGAGAPVEGVVILAAATADAASQTFRVRVELRGDTAEWKTGLKVVVTPTGG